MEHGIDRRLLASNGRVAHVSLRGKVEAERFVEGEARMVVVPNAAILKSPRGPREREIVTGEAFHVIAHEGRFAFGFAARDGYVGYVFADLLFPYLEPTHKVVAARSMRRQSPDLKAWEPVWPLSHGARLQVTETQVTGGAGDWVQVALPVEHGHEQMGEFYVPAAHVAPVDRLEQDPAGVAELYLGTPYLWGGNSAFGIDCSGLVQAALVASGIDCPGDSDMQMSLGAEVEGPLARGDLLFWKGHVAMVVDAARIIHANAHDMAVAYEDTEAAMARIKAQGDGEVLARRRVLPA